MLRILLASLSIFLTLSCQKNRPESAADPCEKYTPSATAQSQAVVVRLKMNKIPQNFSLKIADLKYGKQGVFNMEWDDNTRNALNGISCFDLYHFSDGFGHNINFSATIGVNGYTFNGAEIGCSREDLKYRDYHDFIARGWDIANHSNRHVDTGHASIDIGSYQSDLDALNALYFEKMGYNLNCLIVPANFFGFVPEAEAAGFLCSSSTGHHPYRKKHPEFNQIGNVDSFDDVFLQLNRDFKDDWNAQNIQDVKGKIQQLIDGSNDSVHLFYRLGTHHVEMAELDEIIKYLFQQSGDNIWVCSTREWMEYRFLQTHLVPEIKMLGAEVELSWDYQNIPPHFRWSDLTFEVSSEAFIEEIRIISGPGQVYAQPARFHYSFQSPYKAKREI